MCNRYERVSRPERLRRYFDVEPPADEPGHLPPEVFPRYPGTFLRRRRDSVGHDREAVVGLWSLIPWFARSAKPGYSTNNARWEGVAGAASYRQPWARGQRCIIPAESFVEPNWETGRHVPWRFRRADGAPWGLAGLWNTWTDKATGELVESYTMLTVNADAHPLMRRMHKPDPKLGAEAQDKRSVAALAPEDFDLWLAGTAAEAARLVRPPELEDIDARPDVQDALARQ